MKIIRLSVFTALLFIGCVASNQKFFKEVESATDESYGYTAENPVTIKNLNLKHSIGSSYYYISRLRTKNGNPLKLIERYSVNNPNYEKPGIALKNQFTGESLGKDGPLLDLYILKPINEPDTIELYINPYLKGIVKVPVGLSFEKE